MKILLSARKFIPPFVGGVDVYADRLGRALQRQGHEVIYLAVEPETAIVDDPLNNHAGGTASNTIILPVTEEFQGVKIIRLLYEPGHRPKSSHDQSFDPQMGQVLKEVLAAQAPDLFVILNFYRLTLAPVQAAKELNIPVIHIATDFVPICRRSTYIRWDGKPCQEGESIKSCSTCFVSQSIPGRIAATLSRGVPETTLVRWANQPGGYRSPHPFKLLQPYWNQVLITEKRIKILSHLRDQIDLVLAPTHFTADAFRQNGFRQDQVHILPFGFEKNGFHQEPDPVPAPYIRFLFIGRFQPYKGAHILIDAFNNLKEPKGATLTLYGIQDGHVAYYKDLQTKIAGNGRIRMGGKLSPSDLPEAFANADFFVLPSLWHENSPLILLDALQSHTPVIASDIGGVTDLLHEGQNGLLFRMGDAQALKQVMQTVIDHPDMVNQLRVGVPLPGIEEYAVTMINLARGLALKVNQ